MYYLLIFSGKVCLSKMQKHASSLFLSVSVQDTKTTILYYSVGFQFRRNVKYWPNTSIWDLFGFVINSMCWERCESTWMNLEHRPKIIWTSWVIQKRKETYWMFLNCKTGFSTSNRCNAVKWQKIFSCRGLNVHIGSYKWIESFFHSAY